MNVESSLNRIHSSMKEGAELRLKVAQDCGTNIIAAAEAILLCLRSGGKILFFGNGGSAADAQHLAAEFVGRFVLERRGLPAIALTTDSSILTAIGNDYGFDRVFSRQVEALGQSGDVAVGLSTSGNSPNVLAAIRQAAQQNLKTIGFAGRDGGALAQCADIPLVVACPNTARVQECHIAIGHLLCELVENELCSPRLLDPVVNPAVPSNAAPSAAPGSLPAPGDPAARRQADQQKHLSTDHLLTNLKGRTVSSGLVTITSQGLQFVLNMVSLTILARLLTPDDFGLVAMVLTIMGFLQVFKDAGLSAATIQKEGITHAQVSNLFWVNIALSGAVSLCVAASAPLIAWFYREPRLIPITLALSITLVLFGASAQHLALFNRRMQFTRIALIQLGSMTIGVTIGITMAALKCGYWSLVGMNTGTAISTFTLTWLLSPWRPQFFMRRSKTRPLLNFGANMAAGGFLHTLAKGSDSLLVGRFFGAEAIGLYSRGTVLLIRPLDQILAALNSVFVPSLSRLQNQPERYRAAFLKIFEAIALVSFPFTAMFLALAHPVTLVLLGPKWEKAANIFASFTLVTIFYPLNNIASWLFITQGRGRESFIGFTISSTIMVLSFVAGLPYGPVGIALSFSIACLVLMLPIRFYLAGRSGPVKTKDLWVGFVRYFPLWIVVWAATTCAHTLLADASPFKQVLLCGPAGLGVGALFFWAVGPYRRRARSLVETLGEFKKFRRKK